MQHKLQSILACAAAPFCLFSFVLLGSVGLIRLVVVPLLTRVDINGEQQQLGALLERHAELSAMLLEAETKRSALVLPVQDPTYGVLKIEQQTQQQFNPLFQAINQIVQAAERGGKPVVTLQEIHVNYVERTLRLRGDVRNAGQSSVSVLAWFIDSLRSIPMLADTPTPPYERKEDPYLGQYSPYDIVIPLRLDE
ncbi:MAG TPA: hypothetical protein VI913_05330 [Candidatus Peribacteraceae bacterium]|nr:hypothetical protein [Candidatus Peribacteraceae bacterium]